MKKMGNIKLVLVGFLVLFLTACATIVDESQELVTFNSTPGGAEVYINGEYRGTTPLAIKIKKKQYAVEVKKDGYISQVVNTSTSINPWLFGNIITGGVTGTTTDVVTTAAFRFDQNQWFFNLQEERPNTASLSAEQGK